MSARTVVLAYITLPRGHTVMNTLRCKSRDASSRVVAAVVTACLFLALSLPAVAEPAPLPSNLNLGSINRTATASGNLSSSVTISQGDGQKEITPGMRITAAQAVAVSQILATGTQSIVINDRGKAVGGTVDLSSVANLVSLGVPKNVSVIRDFGTGSNLALTGNLFNAGSIIAVSTNASIDNALISANNIRNASGGLITSVLPAGGVSGMTGAITNLSLSLIALDSIFNAGTISSAGNLNLAAGNQIANSGATAGQA